MQQLTKGRGAQINPNNSFSSLQREEYLDDLRNLPDWVDTNTPSSYTEVYPKTIVNKVDSPDIPANWSMNPYQGCEHGCVYCYARPTHEYWGYSAGKDFEEKIMVKANANALLKQKFRSRSWKADAIMLSGNTDCYQPIERKTKITREILKTCLEHRHPVGIITKNALICRDLDILKELAALKLVHVHISITTLDDEIRRTLEPRTSSSLTRLKTVKTLSENGIPVNVMFAPIIPGLNSEEVFNIAEASKQAGALSMGYTLLRLNGITSLLFEDWIRKAFPLKANRVMNLIAMAQGGKVNNSTFGKRMRGEGVFANTIAQQFKLARSKFDLNNKLPDFDLNLYQKIDHAQLRLF